LAESDTGFEVAANALNSVSRGASIGADFRNSLGEDYTQLSREEFREARNGELNSQLSDFANPFSGFEVGAAGHAKGHLLVNLLGGFHVCQSILWASPCATLWAGLF
jgi:hypothetical protein